MGLSMRLNKTDRFYDSRNRTCEYLDRILHGRRPLRIRILWLAKAVGISYKQMRSNLDWLEKEGLIEKFYGKGEKLPDGKFERELWIRKWIRKVFN